jgi:hypothetical protein
MNLILIFKKTILNKLLMINVYKKSNNKINLYIKLMILKSRILKKKVKFQTLILTQQIIYLMIH